MPIAIDVDGSMNNNTMIGNPLPRTGASHSTTITRMNEVVADTDGDNASINGNPPPVVDDVRHAP